MFGDRVNITANNNQGVQNILGTISGNVDNKIHQLPDSSNSEQPGIKKLLTELKNEIESNNDLSDKQKVKALEQLEELAGAGLQPNQSENKNIAENALLMLRGIISGIPSAVKLLELLPEISKIFHLTL